MQPGQLNHLRAEFTAGDYVLLCFVPDSGDGKPHVAHGMIRQIRVNRPQGRRARAAPRRGGG
jgi:hypothetical protein